MSLQRERKTIPRPYCKWQDWDVGPGAWSQEISYYSLLSLSHTSLGQQRLVQSSEKLDAPISICRFALLPLSDLHFSFYIPPAPNSKWLLPLVMNHESTKHQRWKICSPQTSSVMKTASGEWDWGLFYGNVICEGHGLSEELERGAYL